MLQLNTERAPEQASRFSPTFLSVPPFRTPAERTRTQHGRPAPIVSRHVHHPHPDFAPTTPLRLIVATDDAERTIGPDSPTAHFTEIRRYVQTGDETPPEERTDDR